MNWPKSHYVRHLEAEIEWLKNELAIARGKVERMELAIMPLASPAGAAYARAVKPPTPPPNTMGISTRPGSWAAVQAAHAEELAKKEEKDKIRKENN